MIPTPQLPNIEGTKLKHDDLIFTSSDSKKTRVPVDDYSIIVCENNPTKYVATLFNCLSADDVNYPYYLQHTDLFESAQKIFKDCFSLEPDVLIASVYKKDFTKSSYLFGNRKMIENALNNISNEYTFNLNNSDDINGIDRLINAEKNNRKLPYLTINEKNLNIILPTGVFPVIGVTNDIKFDSNPNFTLILGSFLSEEIYKISKEEYKELEQELRDRNNNEQKSKTQESNTSEWQSFFDQKLRNSFGGGIPLYCIKKYDLHNPNHIINRLSKEQSIHPFDLFEPWGVDDFYRIVNRQAVTKFNETIVRLLIGYNKASYLHIEVDAFVATMADFYELDRTPKTVEYSESLQRALRRKYEKAQTFTQGVSSLSVKHFIEYFIIESIIDFDKFFEDPAKELRHVMAEQDETFKLISSKEILSSFLDNDRPNRNFSEYIDGHISAKNNIVQWI